ncbi:MAG: TrkH family potassium uptake protein, partial [Rhodospirillales bacterium]|nr:TrkH family potassium uptake protein [Rhodospirillales bacterium]
MIDLRPALLVLGFMLVALSISMCVPAIVDFTISNPDWKVFLFSAALGLFIGITLILTNRTQDFHLSIREAVVMTLLIWTVLPFFASIPFMYSDLSLSLTDAYFESMSGLTTTGSTVISGLDTAPPGILIWRAFLQWFGGLGIIVMSISILPMLRIGGSQMFKVEAFDVAGRDTPRMAKISAGITLVFIGSTSVCAIALWLAGMSGLEACVHAMTTIATGGYSTSDASITHFDSPLIEAIITLGMIFGGIPFLLYLRCFQGHFKRLLRDSQVRVYLGILFFSSLALSGWLVLTKGFGLLDALRYAPFSVVSIMTGTGYA